MKTPLRWAVCFGLALGLIGFTIGGAPGAQASTKVVIVEVTSITPEQGGNDLDLAVTISGSGFNPTPQVLLGSQPLQDVVWNSSSELQAVVPWGLLPGTYTLTVINPGGVGQGSLPDAYTVSNGFNNWISGGPYGGIVSQLVFGGTGWLNLYATIPNVGIFRSADNGQNWQMIFSGNGPENALAVDPLQPQRMYAAQTNSGLYRSEDGGSTWTLASLPAEPPQSIYRLRAFPSPHASLLYAAPGNNCEWNLCGLWKSSNYGGNWTQISGGSLATDTLVTDLAFDPGNANILWLGLYDGGVLRSTDGGLTWSDMGQPLGHVARITVNPYTSQAWVTGEGDGFSGGVYKYSGSAWEGVIYQPIASEMWNTSQVAFGQNAAIIWTAAGGTAWRTLDGGTTWDDTFDPVDNHAYSVVQDPNNSSVWYLGYVGQGVYRSANSGATWEERNHGLAGVFPRHMAINPQNPAELIADSSKGLLHTLDGGASWLSLPQAPGGGDMLLPDVDNFEHFCLDGFNNGVVCTTDLGQTYASLPFTPPATYTGAHIYTKAGASGPGVWVAGSGFFDDFNIQHPVGGGWIYYSADGAAWQAAQIEDQYPASTQTIHMVISMAVDPQDPLTVYASTESDPSYPEGDPNRPGRLLKSTDGGQTWSSIQTANTGQQGIADCGGILALDPQPPYGMALACGSDLHFSTNGGLNWSDFPLNVPLDNSSPIDLLHFVAYPGSSRFYAGGPDGLVYTNYLYTANPVWQRAEGRLGSLEPWAIASLVVRDQTERIYLYVSTIGGMSSAKTSQLTPAGVYRFSSLYPLIFLPVIQR
jgi:photosystem II stability/assembly factor-like uncharacterized protein